MDTGGIRRHRMTGGSPRVFGWLSPRAAIVAGLAVALTLVAVVVVVVQGTGSRGGSPLAAPATAEAGAGPGAGATAVPTPPPSDAPTVTSSPRPTSGPRGITAAYAVTRSWEDGFVERITLTNHGGAPASWTVTLVLPAGTTVTKVWRAEMRQSGTTFEFTRTEQMAPLAAGATMWFGFEAEGTASNDQACEVNGRPCD
jgi:hypothetical protein